MLNTGYNKQSVRTNMTQTFLPNMTLSANLNYIHDLTRRSITGNDNNRREPVQCLLLHAAVRSTSIT